MASSTKILFNLGNRTSVPPEELENGELTRSTGAWYRPGDQQAVHKQGGRTEFGDTGSGDKVYGVGLAQFDSGGTDKIVALTSGPVDPGALGDGPDIWLKPEVLQQQAESIDLVDGSTIPTGFVWPNSGSSGKDFAKAPVATALYRSNSIGTLSAIEVSTNGAQFVYDLAGGTYDALTGGLTMAVLFRNPDPDSPLPLSVHVGNTVDDGWGFRGPTADAADRAAVYVDSGTATPISDDDGGAPGPGAVQAASNVSATHYIQVWRRNASDEWTFYHGQGTATDYTPTTPLVKAGTITLKSLWKLAVSATTVAGPGYRTVELIIYPEALTDAQLANLFSYLAIKSGLGSAASGTGRALYSATPGVTGTFAQLKIGLASNANSLSMVHYDDRFYLALADGKNQVLKPDGTVRDMGMDPPIGAATASAAAAAGDGVERPGAGNVTGWTDGDNARDADLATFAYTTLSSTGVSQSIATASFTGVAGTTSSHSANVRYAVQQTVSSGGSGVVFNDAGATAIVGRFDFKIELSEDAGSNYSTVFSVINSRHAIPVTDFQVALTDSGAPVVNRADIRLRLTLTANIPVSRFRAISAFLFDVNIDDGGDAAAFSTTTGFYIGTTEYNANDILESPPQTPRTLVTMMDQAILTITRPPIVNGSATHWKVYRTTDGGSDPHQLGEIATLPITQSTFVDTFIIDKDTQAFPLIPLLSIRGGGDDATPLRVFRDNPPPSLRKLRLFKGSLVGLSAGSLRAMFYSVPSLPESWPSLYVISNFPLPEHDELVDCIELSGTLLVAAIGAMMRLDELPRLIDGKFVASDVVKIEGAPGCVGLYALTSYSVRGEARAAWISPYGIYITNAHTYEPISLNMAWEEAVDVGDSAVNHDALEAQTKSGWVLHWDPRRYLLVFAFSNTSGAENNRYYLFHMHPSQARPDGQPKITGPHPGEYAHMVSGQVSGRGRTYSAHIDDGKIYLEDNGTTDASLSYDGSGTWPLALARDRLYMEWQEWAALRGNLRHDDWGAGQALTLGFQANVDSSGYQATKSVTVSLVGQKGTALEIGRRAEWAKITLDHTGAATGKLNDLRLLIRALGPAGKVT